MPDSKGTPAGGKPPDQNIDDCSGSAEVDISGGPDRWEKAVNFRGLQLRAHGCQQLALWKEDPKNRREDADFVDTPTRRELRPIMPGSIEDTGPMGKIKICAQ